jgi:DNA adenine methylase
VLYHKPRSKVEVYNDIAGGVWNFFDVFVRRTDDLIDRLDDVYHAKAQYDEWTDTIPDDDVERAARFFFFRYANWGSKLDPAGFRRMTHRSVADNFRDAVDALPDKADRLHGVTIDRLDWAECVDKYDGDDTLFYFDPPYVAAGDDLYAHDDDFDHGRFADRLHDIDGDWVVSLERVPDSFPEYDAEATRDTKDRVSNGQEPDPTERTERLCMSFDPAERARFTAADQASVDAFR